MIETGAPFTQDEIARANAVSVTTILRQRGITNFKEPTTNKKWVSGSCPACGGHDRFCLSFREKAFHCRGCGTKGSDNISLVMFLDGVGFSTAVERLTGVTAVEPGRSTGQLTNKDDDYRGLALATWREAEPAKGTPVEGYLAGRKLWLPTSCVIRFHPACPFGSKQRVPAMIALIRDIKTDQPLAIHRTSLDRNGRKAAVKVGDSMRARMTLGASAGGAIKLTEDAHVSVALGIGEGIETTLSLQQLPEWRGSPVWSVLSANGVCDFPVLSGIATLVVGVDNDAPDQHGRRAGQEAAATVARRWRAAGREVLLARPLMEGRDLNDVIN